MNDEIVRVYADTSVFGGVFDEEFSVASQLFFEQVRSGELRLVVSEVIRKEIQGAPAKVKELFDAMLVSAEVADVTSDALRLRQAYLNAGILGPQWSDDALHVALATITGCTMIVSWNFKHIVHYQKIPLYNTVNVRQGYNAIFIYSPLEVVGYGRNDEGL
ncbi:MAG TPA: type II toxin-antitoxin system VapC family toxin [Pyrinomonadaceae bacterium]|nr:type II toxin-antitoxin system VapC family toxin [Pyrinomonadaceae bacterium]